MVTMTPIAVSVVDNLQRQITLERFSSAVYHQLSLCMEDIGWAGIAKFFKCRSIEEQGHADQLIEFLVNKNVHVMLENLDRPDVVDDVLTAFRNALAHELRVTAQLNNIYWLCVTEREVQGCDLMQRFMREQVEEERSLVEIIMKLEATESDSAALLIIDKELGSK